MRSISIRKVVASALLAGAAVVTIAATPAAAQETAPTVSPVLECVFDAGEGTFIALWGYSNRNEKPVEVPIGKTNRFTPEPEGRGQTETFEVGRVVGAFTTKFDGSNLVWSLTGRTATAGKASQRCKDNPVPVGSDSPQAVVLLGAIAGVIVIGGGVAAWATTRKRRRATAPA